MIYLKILILFFVLGSCSTQTQENKKTTIQSQKKENMSDEHYIHDKEAKKAIKENIEKFDFHIALIEPDNYLPGFVYTIGLYEKFKHPEIICYGLNNEVMHYMLNYAHDLVKKGTTFKSNENYDGFLKDFPIQFLKVNENFYADYVGYACWYYGNLNFPLLQIVWPDKNSNFPWQNNFNPDWKFKQPLLDRNIDFKFYEERNLGVYTTKQVLDGEPILFVYHNEDGDWQFHSTLEPKIEDVKLVSLENITKLDPTINEIYFLQYGFKAWRNTNNDWEYEEDENIEE